MVNAATCARALWAMRPDLPGSAKRLLPVGVALAIGALGGGAVAAHLARGRAVVRRVAAAPTAAAVAAPTPAVAGPDDADSGPWAKRPTPMRPEEAAQHLADAWQSVLSEPAPDAALALLWAQWALETGRGRWMVDFNFAGVKGTAPRGGSAVWWTSEGSNDDARRVRSRFRAYRSAEEGARDYVSMLHRRYPDAIRAARRGDARGFVQALAKRGYFTSDSDAYCRALSSLARQFLDDDFDGLPPS